MSGRKTSHKENQAATGRPSKFTPETREQILIAVRSGNNYATAAARAGVAYRTFRRWMQAGEEAQGDEFCQFCQAVKKAEADALVASLARIRAAGAGQSVLVSETVRTLPNGEVVSEKKYRHQPPQCQADAWFLERRHPQDWGRRDRLAVENDPLDWESVPDEVLDDYLAGRIEEEDVRRALAAVQAREQRLSRTAR